MAVDKPKQTYTGAIREIDVGASGAEAKVGGETSYPFYVFEGEMPRKPLIGYEINDVAPEAWPKALQDVFGAVGSDPVAWAKKCVDEFGADFIHLELVGTDPNGKDLDAAHAAKVAKAVSDVVKVPMAVWGSGNEEKDKEVLRQVAEACSDRKLMIGPVQEANHKQVGAAVIGYGHVAINSTPIDINLAKQLNILTANLGVSEDKMVMDPTVGGLGYGLEYTYSVMERSRQAALTQQDDKLQYPMYCNLGREVWKTKEAAMSQDEAPTLGDPAKRGVMIESITAASLLVAGADMLVMRHPESVKLTRQLIEDLAG
jgi:acetyl-CoA decarbonylase/synthase complex subunit delta